ncbi:MAG TPA: UDP-N-acetylmuramoyl-L-alanyl-D-glutamate--2,6-diaminopimelate ligase [Acidimicrobiia bacterium]|nr:UDP-N-acetylmuramoyl-L-alanyl-D-glutamate--2,6-diaminopimelate ligase [Acidimicrobiia bacterium]
MRFEELLGDVEVLELRGDPGVDVSSVEHDSRSVQAGACFACIPGAVADGHEHAPSAVRAGAVALLVERPLELGVAEARVESVREALGPAAARLHGHPSRAMRCLGVTGTNGKTTVTRLLESIAGAAGERAGVIGTLGARIDGTELPVVRTTPEADELQALLARMRDAHVTTVAMEVSSHALAQHRVDAVSFAAACFTNLSQDHLDFHATMDEYFMAKAALFTPDRVAIAVVNQDDTRGRELAVRCALNDLPLVTFGVDSRSADVVATDVRPTSSGTRFRLHDRRTGDSDALAFPHPGRFNVSNALAAAATALASGLPFDAVARGLQAPVTVPGRLERVDAGQPFTVLVDYAHTPAALESVLAAARELADGHRVLVVFGCGGDRDAAKRPLMGRAAARGADVVVITSDNPRSEDPARIAAAALEGVTAAGGDAVVELDRRAAIRHAVAAAEPGDVVVIAGKGHETGQTAAALTLPFDDRVVAREELEARS